MTPENKIKNGPIHPEEKNSSLNKILEFEVTPNGAKRFSPFSFLFQEDRFDKE